MPPRMRPSSGDSPFRRRAAAAAGRVRQQRCVFEHGNILHDAARNWHVSGQVRPARRRIGRLGSTGCRACQRTEGRAEDRVRQRRGQDLRRGGLPRQRAFLLGPARLLCSTRELHGDTGDGAHHLCRNVHAHGVTTRERELQRRAQREAQLQGRLADLRVSAAPDEPPPLLAREIAAGHTARMVLPRSNRPRPDGAATV